DAADQIVLAKNQALRQPALNLQIARAYLAGSDSGVATRTWAMALDAIIQTKQGSTRERWERAAKDKALAPLLPKIIMETRAEEVLAAVTRGKVSTNIQLRKLHNFCVAMTWLPWPLVPKPQWPAIRFKERRAVTAEEHQRILEREREPERRAFYECCWHLGGSQSDLAVLKAEDVDWERQVVSFFRAKTGVAQIVRMGPGLAEILGSLPRTGPLFPHLATLNEKQRASYFQCICRRLKITGISLHSYRYAWAERAKTAGYPERFAQEALGHNSKAVHRAYARHAAVLLPSLEDYESKVVPFRAISDPLPKPTLNGLSRNGEQLLERKVEAARRE
ncbi:MAG TPA: hypothetical protein DCE44_15305, partial [Verrucomicrobiales bacterium]|nr:hypothetical protein [Verrucomicrobiales bacterium]